MTDPAALDAAPKPIRRLVQVYEPADAILAEHIERLGNGRPVACSDGCCACCLCMAVPATALEVSGITWFVLHQLDVSARLRLSGKLRTWTRGASCPFLLDASCSVHPMRPLSCRQLIVFGRPCELNEDVHGARPGDVLTLEGDACGEVPALMLHALGLGSPGQCRTLAREGALPRYATDMTEVDWQGALAG